MTTDRSFCFLIMGSILYLPFCLFALSVTDSSVQVLQKVKLKTTANLRNQLVLRCLFSGTTDVSKITWQKDGKYLTHYDENTQVKNWPRLREIQERLNYQELVVDGKTENDTGVYSCMVERKDGTAKRAKLSVNVTQNLTEFGIFSNEEVRSTTSCSQGNIPIDSNTSVPYTCLSLGYAVNGGPSPSLSIRVLNSSMLEVECSWTLSSNSKLQRTRICLHVPVYQGFTQIYFVLMWIFASLAVIFGGLLCAICVRWCKHKRGKVSGNCSSKDNTDTEHERSPCLGRNESKSEEVFELSDEKVSASCSIKEITGTDDRTDPSMNTNESKKEAKQEVSNEKVSASCSSKENIDTEHDGNASTGKNEDKFAEKQGLSDEKGSAKFKSKGDIGTEEQNIASMGTDKNKNEEKQKLAEDAAKKHFVNILKRYRTKFVAELNVSDGLYNYLIQDDIALSDTIARIRQEGRPRERQVEELLDYLPTRPVENLEKFVEALKQTNQSHLAPLFEWSS